MAPKVDCIAKKGKYEYFFHSNDHEPPHIHVRRKGEWEIKVKFLTCTANFLDFEKYIPKNVKLKSAIQNEILADIFPVKEQLYKEWCEKVQTESKS